MTEDLEFTQKHKPNSSLKQQRQTADKVETEIAADNNGRILAENTTLNARSDLRMDLCEKATKDWNVTVSKIFEHSQMNEWMNFRSIIFNKNMLIAICRRTCLNAPEKPHTQCTTHLVYVFSCKWCILCIKRIRQPLKSIFLPENSFPFSLLQTFTTEMCGSVHRNFHTLYFPWLWVSQWIKWIWWNCCMILLSVHTEPNGL